MTDAPLRSLGRGFIPRLGGLPHFPSFTVSFLKVGETRNRKVSGENFSGRFVNPDRGFPPLGPIRPARLKVTGRGWHGQE